MKIMSYQKPGVTYPTPEERNARPVSARAVPVSVRRIPDGYAGTAAIIAEMRRLALDAFQNERINRLARGIAWTVAGRDHLGELENKLHLGGPRSSSLAAIFDAKRV